MAVTGSHLSHTAKMYSRMTPLTNSGMTVIDSEETVIPRSRKLSLRSPAKTPNTMDTGTMITSAKPASRSELPSAFMTVGRTGMLRRGETPQSPVTKPAAQLA